MNDTEEELAAPVRAILESAADRPGGERRLSVDAQSLTTAFAAAEDEGRIPIIAEVKPTSPTTNGTNTTDPVELAESMVAGGAAALSVLTEPDHFGGSVENLERIRAAVDVPVLRKDFILRESQLDSVESDVILLIARFVGDDLPSLLAAAEARGFQALVEVHTAAELEAAVDAGASIIGINNRDLGQLDVDLATFERLAPLVPDETMLIAESGVSTVADVEKMRAAGADGLLIGTAIMDGDPTTNTRRFTQTEATDDDRTNN